jgi:hypothetical protein
MRLSKQQGMTIQSATMRSARFRVCARIATSSRNIAAGAGSIRSERKIAVFSFDKITF